MERMQLRCAPTGEEKWLNADQGLVRQVRTSPRQQQCAPDGAKRGCARRFLQEEMWSGERAGCRRKGARARLCNPASMARAATWHALRWMGCSHAGRKHLVKIAREG